MFQDKEKAVFFEKAIMFDKIQFCKIYKVDATRESGAILHSHDYMQIWYITKGCCEHCIEGQTHLMTRGDVFVVPPKIEHKITKVEECEIICCDLDFEQFFPDENDSTYQHMRDVTISSSFVWLFLKDAGEIRSCFSQLKERSETIHFLFSSMLEEYEREDLFFKDFIRVKIMELLLVLSREYSRSPQITAAEIAYNKYKPLVEQTILYINDHYSEALKLEDVCRKSMVSKTYFCYLFKMLTKQTLIEYIMNLRVKKAMELLDVPENSITWVGYEVGFNDSSHFSRTFKKITGVSPRTYRIIKSKK